MEKLLKLLEFCWGEGMENGELIHIYNCEGNSLGQG